MKRCFALLLVLSLILCGCGGKAPATEPTTEPVIIPVEEDLTEPTTEVTEQPTEPPTEPIVYHNPLNGQVIDAPYTCRIFAHTISNVPYALPHVGTNQADILMEMFANDSVVRCLALYTDVASVPMIGATRSDRLMFNAIAEHYDAIIAHAGGAPTVLNDANSRELEHVNVDTWSQDNYYSVRDKDRNRKLGWEHCLMSYGDGLYRLAQEKGFRLTQPEDKDYLLRFNEDGTPADGETANSLYVALTFRDSHKETNMLYDAELGKYVYHQYKKEMVDGATEEKEAFRNVLVLHAAIDSIFADGARFQTVDFTAGGTGYFACGGKIVPIQFTCDGADQPIRYLTMDGEPLELGVGNTYIAVCTPESEVAWSDAADPIWKY